MKKLKSCYVRINFSGMVLRHAAGHAVAAWLGQPTQDRITWARDRITGLRPVPGAQDYFHKGTSGDAVFFDPAYGEYWFEQKDDFFHFFPVFYRAAYRSFPMYFDQAWQVLPCAKSI